MESRTASLKDVAFLEMQGEIDHDTCRGLETALHGVLDSGSSVVILDLSKVHYIDSGGLSVIFSGIRQLREGGWLGLVGPNPNVRRLLELVGLIADPSVRVFEDRQAAEAALTGKIGVE